jgi:hypothetical protein
MGFMQIIGSWRSYIVVLIPFTLVSLIISFNLQRINTTLASIYYKIRMTHPRANMLSQLEAGLHGGYDALQKP